MYRVIAIVGAGLALAACSSSPEWLKFDSMKPGPTLETVRFESEPPGAEAKTPTAEKTLLSSAAVNEIQRRITRSIGEDLSMQMLYDER